VPIDNNGSEREMKRVALNRKNSLFVGSPPGDHPGQLDIHLSPPRNQPAALPHAVAGEFFFLARA